MSVKIVTYRANRNNVQISIKIRPIITHAKETMVNEKVIHL